MTMSEELYRLVEKLDFIDDKIEKHQDTLVYELMNVDRAIEVGSSYDLIDNYHQRAAVSGSILQGLFLMRAGLEEEINRMKGK
jgi:hypothetical protein